MIATLATGALQTKKKQGYVTLAFRVYTDSKSATMLLCDEATQLVGISARLAIIA